MAREGNDLWATEVQVDGIALPLHELAAGEQLSRVIGRKMDHLCSHQCARTIKTHEVGQYQSCMVFSYQRPVLGGGLQLLLPIHCIARKAPCVNHRSIRKAAVVAAAE